MIKYQKFTNFHQIIINSEYDRYSFIFVFFYDSHNNLLKNIGNFLRFFIFSKNNDILRFLNYWYYHFLNI